ncbi:MAG: phosphatase PAP2 family protein [Actinomycetota bacterium]|nr:phosphatase PAP2 family protein [Actinomycetota bacterium]
MARGRLSPTVKKWGSRAGVLGHIARFVVFGLIAAGLIAYGIYCLVDARLRDVSANVYVVHSSSFPAGHAATAFAGAVVLSVVAPRLAPAFLGLAVLIAISRVYVGVHYPTDVLAGAVLGALVGAAGAAVLRLPALHPREV